MKAHPPQPVPNLQQLLLFLSQSRGAPCIPVEMGLNPPDQKVLPAFAASHEAHASIRLGQLSILIIFLYGCGKTILCDWSHHSVKGLSLEAVASKEHHWVHRGAHCCCDE